MAITQEFLKEIFTYKDGFLYWKVKIASKIIIGSCAGSLDKRSKQNRFYIIIKRKRYLSSRLIFLYHKGYLPKNVDHKDRIRTNDKIENLRDSTCSQNNKNKNPRKNCSSKYLGVHFHSAHKIWQANIQSNKKQIYLGKFKTENEAALAYNEAAKIHHGEFANLNIVK